jgi:hypothetical protein
MQTHSIPHQLSLIEGCQLYCLGLFYLSQNPTMEKVVTSIADKAFYLNVCYSVILRAAVTRFVNTPTLIQTQIFGR